MWRVSWLAAAACSFTSGAASSVPSDGRHDGAEDAPTVDAETYSACAVTSTGSSTAVTPIGGSPGGNGEPSVACANADELPVGMAFDLSNAGNPASSEPVVRKAVVRCGSLARAMSGAIATTLDETETTGLNSGCPGWDDNAIAEQDCPSGAVLVGMTANKPDNSTSLYNTVALTCAPILPSLHFGATTLLTYANTGSYDDNPEQAMCPAGMVFVGFTVQAGCANDELVPHCAAIGCN